MCVAHACENINTYTYRMQEDKYADCFDLAEAFFKSVSKHSPPSTVIHIAMLSVVLSFLSKIELSRVCLVCQEWLQVKKSCAALMTQHELAKSRGPYGVYSTAMKDMLRKVVSVVGLKKAIENPTFTNVPTSTLRGWAKDDDTWPVEPHKRRTGGGRKPAYSNKQMKLVFDELDELRDIKRITPFEVKEKTRELLPTPSNYPNFAASREWVRDMCSKNKFDVHQVIPSDANAPTAHTPEQSANFCTQFLREVYDFRNHIRVHFCDGSYLKEFLVSMGRMFYFDEVPVEREASKGKAGKSISKKNADPPHNPGQGISHKHYTVGLTSTPLDMLIPMIVFEGSMQPTQNLQDVVVSIKGKTTKVKVFVVHNSTHTNNQFAYKEYLRACIIPNLPVHDCACSNPECKSTLFMDDSAWLHQTAMINEVWGKHPHVLHLVVPGRETKHIAPNDDNINKNFGMKMRSLVDTFNSEAAAVYTIIF